MKKLALKGLAVLAGVVLLCLFFSGTLHGIMTAKVRLVSPRLGTMETELTMTGSLYWPRPMNLYPALGEQDSLTVLEVLARKGARVQAGELLIRCEVTDYESRMDSLSKNELTEYKDMKVVREMYERGYEFLKKNYTVQNTYDAIMKHL